MSVVATLAEVKALGRIDYSSQDTLLQLLLDGAEDFVERCIQVRFTKATVTERLEGGGGALFPTRLPIQSVTSIKDKWEGDVEPPVTTYINNEKTQIRIEEDGCWPAGTDRWEVQYEGGFDGDVPVGLKTIIMQLALRAFASPELRSSGGGSGAVNFQSFMDSDAMLSLSAFSFRKVIQ